MEMASFLIDTLDVIQKIIWGGVLTELKLISYSTCQEAQKATNKVLSWLNKELIKFKIFFTLKVYLSLMQPIKFPKLLFVLMMGQLFLILLHQKGNHTPFLLGSLQYHL